MEVLFEISIFLLSLYGIGVVLVLFLFMLKEILQTKIGRAKPIKQSIKDLKILFNMLKSWYYVPTAYRDCINELKFNIMKIIRITILLIFLITLIVSIVSIIDFFGLNVFFEILFENLNNISIYIENNIFIFLGYMVSFALSLAVVTVIASAMIQSFKNKGGE